MVVAWQARVMKLTIGTNNPKKLKARFGFIVLKRVSKRQGFSFNMREKTSGGSQVATAIADFRRPRAWSPSTRSTNVGSERAGGAAAVRRGRWRRCLAVFAPPDRRALQPYRAAGAGGGWCGDALAGVDGWDHAGNSRFESLLPLRTGPHYWPLEALLPDIDILSSLQLCVLCVCAHGLHPCNVTLQPSDFRRCFDMTFCRVRVLACDRASQRG